MAQQARNLLMGLEERVGRFRFVIRDRDAKLTSAFDVVSAAEAIEVLATPVRPAGQRLRGAVGTVRREALDRMLIFGCWQLRLVLADHCNVHRPCRALDQAPPLGSVVSAAVVSAGEVVRRIDLVG